MNELYEPFLERELEAIPDAVRAYRAEHSPEETWLAVTRFALLAYAPSEHSRHALLCCLAVHDLGITDDWLVELARYAAESRQPWSEPPILEPPVVESDPGSLRDLLEDRHAAERWLAFHLGDAEEELREVAAEHGDSILVVNAAIRLVPLLGEKGKYATLRVGVWDVLAKRAEGRVEVTGEVGSLDNTHGQLVAAVQRGLPARSPQSGLEARAAPYRLARDYGQLLLAHAAGLRPDILEAIRQNLDSGENYDEWTFA